jgi:hypothetical protein
MSLARRDLLTRRRGLDFRDCRRAEAKGSRQQQQAGEAAMKTLYDDVANALVTVTFAVALVSTLVTVLAGAA